MKSARVAIALIAAAAIAGCDASGAYSIDGCHAELQKARKYGGVDERVISWTDVQYGYTYDDGTGIAMEHFADFDWSSGKCVVTNPPPGF